MTTLDPARSALVLVDLMERTVDMPVQPRPGTEVVDAACRLAEAFRAAGAPVVAIRVERPHVDPQPPGSGLVKRIADLADAVVVKGTIGGFHGTGLHDVLRRFGAHTLVFGGIATNMGVESTARAASDHGYDLVFAEDAMSALTAAEHDAAVRLDLPRFGTVAASADIRLAPAAD